MSNQDPSRANPTSSNRQSDAGRRGEVTKPSGSDSSMTAEVSAKAKQLASDTAETVTQQTKHLLDGQLNAGADLIAAVAGATRRASEELKQESPQMAEFVRTVAKRVDDFSGQLRDQSVGDLMRSAGNFTRQQPALVFGLAALAGFFALRVVKAAPSGSSVMSSPSIQPYSEHGTRHGHGARTN